jgi:DNA ligase (NAD+)
VLTGALPDLTRDERPRGSRHAGGHVTDAVSRYTDYIVVGEAPGRKLEDAQRLGVDTLDRAGLEALLG